MTGGRDKGTDEGRDRRRVRGRKYGREGGGEGSTWLFASDVPWFRLTPGRLTAHDR